MRGKQPGENKIQMLFGQNY